MPSFANPFESGSVSSLPLAKIDSIRGSLLCSASPTGQGREWQAVPIGTRLVLDQGIRFFGGVSFKPTYAERLVLDGMVPPDVPNDGRDWQPIIKLPILIEDRGLFMLSVPGRIQQNRFRALLQMFNLQAEAQKGLLQEYLLRPFDSIELDYGVFFGLVLQPNDWIERDVELFGPRLIPPPPPFIGGPAMRPKLSNDNGGAAAPVPPANDPAPASTTAPTPQAANDPLGRYRPAGAGQRPF